VSPEISLGGNFSFDYKGEYYSTTTIYGYIKRSNITESYECLASIMNSKLLWWYLVNTGTTLANGYYRYKPAYIDSFPFPIISEVKQSELSKLYNIIVDLRTRNLDTLKYENETNNLIYLMYELSEKEINIINALNG